MAATCLCLAPVEVNGDGIGYLKAARDGVLYPGHLAYVPILRACWRIATTSTQLTSAIGPGRVLSALSAALACLLCGQITARRTSTNRGLLAGAGLGASAGLLGAGCDLESYAPALAALLLVVWLLDRDRPILAAFALALATLFHIENALFGLAALMLTHHRVRFSVIAVGAVLLAYVVVGLSVSSLPRASHGFSYPLHVYTPLVAIWGALRTLVFSSYLYEASLGRVCATTAVALVFATAISVGARSPFPRRVVLAWVLPYAIVGILFFPSDPERWIFVLPLLWIASNTRAWVVAVLLAVNVALWLPHARNTHTVDAARAAATHLVPGDVVLMPGHGWDESIVLFADGVNPFPLVYHAAASGDAGGLAVALDRALASATRVVSVRLEPGDNPSGSLGYKELHTTRDSLRALLAAHGLARPTPLGDGVTLYLTTPR